MSGNVDLFFFDKNWQCGFTIDVMTVIFIICDEEETEKPLITLFGRGK